MTELDLAIGAAVLGAALTQGVLGFGYGIVLMAILPGWMPLDWTVAFVATFGILVAGLVFVRYRRQVRWDEVLILLPAAALGVPAGLLAVAHLPAEVCIRSLGVLLIAFSLWSVWPRSLADGAAREAVSRVWGQPAGLLSGAFGSALAMGGPPAIAYFAARHFTPGAFKAALQAFFVILTAMVLIGLAVAGTLTGDVLLKGAFFLPLLPIGVWAGAWLADRLRAETFRRLVLLALLILGVRYVVMGR